MSIIKRLPKIPEDQITPLAAEQIDLIQPQMEEIQLFKDEIARLKNQKQRPKIKPSTLERPPNKGKAKKRKKRPKKLKPKRLKSMMLFIAHRTICPKAAN
jgi:hypothetical protein